MVIAAQLSSDSVQQHNQDALTTVLGVCLLIIGLCAFAGVVLLFQQLQKSDLNKDSALAEQGRRLVPRRASKPMVATAQFRPLGEGLRHRGELTRQSSGNRSASLLTSADISLSTLSAIDSFPARNSLGVGGTSNSTLTGAASAAAQRATDPTAAKDSDVALTPAASGVQITSNSIYSGTDGMTATKPVDKIDLGLLSRIDEALASGYMRPQQATQLLKSYGCDVEELLRSELNNPQVSGGGSATPRMYSGGSGGSAASLLSIGIGGGARGSCGEARGGSGTATTVPTGASAGSNPVIDDALLLKIDMALASGCVTPDQATQLLKSYGCDLEELLREELGEGATGPSREPSSGLSQ